MIEFGTWIREISSTSWPEHVTLVSAIRGNVEFPLEPRVDTKKINLAGFSFETTDTLHRRRNYLIVFARIELPITCLGVSNWIVSISLRVRGLPRWRARNGIIARRWRLLRAPQSASIHILEQIFGKFGHSNWWMRRMNTSHWVMSSSVCGCGNFCLRQQALNSSESGSDDPQQFLAHSLPPGCARSQTLVFLRK